MRALSLSAFMVGASFGAFGTADAQGNGVGGAGIGIEWTVVDSLPIPAGTVPWQPSIAIRGDTVYVASNLVDWADGKPARGRPLLLMRRPGGDMPLPPGNFTFAHARGLIDAEGAYHLFWGEAPGPDDGFYPGPNVEVKAIWHSIFTGNRWTEPEIVMEAHRVSWVGEAGTIVLDDKGRIHVAAPGRETGSTWVFHARRESGRWRLQKIGGSLAAYVSILAGPGDTLAIAISGGYDAHRSTLPEMKLNVLGIVESSDGGDTWTSPRLLETLTARQVYHLVGSVDGDGRMHLAWSGVHESEPSQRLEYYVSADRGRSWELKHGADATGTLALSELVIGPCGAQILGTMGEGPRSQLLSLPGVNSRVLADEPFVEYPTVGLSSGRLILSLLLNGKRSGRNAWLLLAPQGCGMKGAL